MNMIGLSIVLLLAGAIVWVLIRAGRDHEKASQQKETLDALHEAAEPPTPDELERVRSKYRQP